MCNLKENEMDDAALMGKKNKLGPIGKKSKKYKEEKNENPQDDVEEMDSEMEDDE